MSWPRPFSRRRFVRDGAAGLVGAAVFRPGRIEAAPRFDVLLQGGTILDGTGGPGFRADVAVVGDAIAALGRIAPEQARRVMEVEGLHVCPGFIDIHSHSDGDVLAFPLAESRVRQGVTTELTGNCGSSAAPLLGEDLEERRRDLQEEGVRATWTDVASYLARLETVGTSVNQALLLGQGTLRRNLVGMVNRHLRGEELQRVVRAVEDGVEQGAFGVSTGLEYTPGRYTPTEEIVAMARVVARYGGLYASHLRNEEAMLLEAVDEAIAIGRRSGARVEISHLKAAGRPNWGKQRAALDLIESARREGIEVLADAYPYTAYSTGLMILLPDWALEGGTAAAVGRLRDPESRSRIRDDVEAQMARELGDYALIVVSRLRSAANRSCVGRNMVEIADSWSLEPVDAVLKLLDEEEGSVSYVGHGMSPENVETVLAHPLVMIGSDGAALAPVGRAADSRPNPRLYGTFARVLSLYVRERRLLELSAAVRKMTSMPADQIGLHDRGRLARGRKADLVVFDAGAVKDEATFEDPHRYPSGIVHVLVNGRLVVENGRHTGAKPGRALRKA